MFCSSHLQDPSSSDYLTELGYQLGLLGDHDDALSSFKNALTVDEGNVNALLGVINCQVFVDNAESGGGRTSRITRAPMSPQNREDPPRVPWGEGWLPPSLP